MAVGEEKGRRGALKAFIVGGSAAFGCALAGPAAVFVSAPLRAATATGHGARWVKTLRLAEIHEGQPKKVAVVADQRDAWTLSKDVELGAVWLVKEGERVLAFSVVCPHLGCSVSANPDGSFGCPCHTSSFDAAGKRTGGPSPRGMDPLDTKVEDGVVLVDFRKFRMGTPERVEIG